MAGFSTLAIVILRNNKRKRLDKLERVERYIGTTSSTAEYSEATPYMLNKIKKRIQAEQHASRRRTVIIFSVVGFVLVAVLYYFLFVYKVSNDFFELFQFG